MKIWDDDGVACVIKSSLVKSYIPLMPEALEVLSALCTEEGQRLIAALDCTRPMSKQKLIEKTGIELARLNELLLLLTENKVIEFVADHSPKTGYMMCGHCGVAAYMVLAALHVLNKKRYEVSQYIVAESDQ